MAFSLSRLWRFSPRVTTVRLLPQFYSKFEVDTIDEFTSQLVQRKVEKWDHKKRQTETFLEHKSKMKISPKGAELDVDLTNLKLLFCNLMDTEDTKGVINLTRLCIQQERPPPKALLINILAICSQNGEKDTIQELLKVCKNHYPDLLAENSNFNHYIAEAIWVNGDVLKALEILEDTYRHNPYLRRRIRLMFKYLSADLVASGSEAALSNAITFSERILGEFQDFSPLTSVWQACFLSEWFTEQKKALEMLKKHSGFCKSVTNRIPYVVFISLKCHRTEIVYRLMEILLIYKMKPQYSSVLGTLLDYQFRSGNWVRCSEIINWAVENEVSLPQKCHIQMINMLLNQKMNTPLATLEKKLSKEMKCDFKF